MRKKEELRNATACSAKLRALKKWGMTAVFGAVVAFGAWMLFKSIMPQTPDKSVFYQSMGQNHIAVGAPHEPYNSNPPTSGPHYAEPARSGFYAEELADEQLVHNLEHGEIWIAFRPDIPPDVKKELEGLTDNWIVAAPRSANDTDIALVAWTRLDKFNLENGRLDVARVKDFIKRYKNKGPEKLPPSAHISK